LTATATALLVTFAVGCGPAAPTDVNVDTATPSSNVTADGSGNVTAGTDTPVSETP
jgi:hypothetical protein